jgi:aminocarboxymuconate-semialdehyde decarboxylase
VEISSNVNGRELAEPEFRPFFAAAEALGVLVFVHPLGFTHGQRLSEHYFNNLIGNPLESTIAVGHLIFGGVLDAHPGLKLCIAHGGGYLPGYIGRMDHAFRAREDCRAHIHREPSTYLRQLYFDTLVFDRGQLKQMVDTYGAGHLMMGTDYPFDMSEPDPVRFQGGLSEADREAVLGGTAARLLGLPVAQAAQ